MAINDMHDRMASTARQTLADGRERAIRTTQKTLHTVILSHPGGSPEDLAKWEALSIQWLLEQYGAELAGVVKHSDEAFPHLHAFVVPSDPEMMAARYHPGWVAKRAASADGQPVDICNRAYKDAMRSWQDDYHIKVAQPCGLTRIGPARQRQSRAEWRRTQQQAQALKNAQEASEAVLVATEDQVQQVISDGLEVRKQITADVKTEKAKLAKLQVAAPAFLKSTKLKANNILKTANNVMLKAANERDDSDEALKKLEAKVAKYQRWPSVIRMIYDGFSESKIYKAATAKAEKSSEKKFKNLVDVEKVETEKVLTKFRGLLESSQAELSAAISSRNFARKQNTEKSSEIVDLLTDQSQILQALQKTQKDLLDLRKRYEPDYDPHKKNDGNFRP